MSEAEGWRDVLVQQVRGIVGESGDPERAQGFDARTWVDGFRTRPHLAFGGRPPDEFMATAEGRARVSQHIAQTQSGAYA